MDNILVKFSYFPLEDSSPTWLRKQHCLCLVAIPWPLSSVVILLWLSFYKFVSDDVAIHSSSHQRFWLVENWKSLTILFRTTVRNETNLNIIVIWWSLPKLCPLAKTTFPNDHLVVILQWCITNLWRANTSELIV